MNAEAAEEYLASLLVAGDEALAAGHAPSAGEAGAPAEVQARMGRALAALKFLHEARPRGRPGGAAEPPDESTTHRHAEEPSTGLDALPSGPFAAPVQIGRFQLLRELGRGGFGVVFLAHDPRLGREVALKVPRLDTLLTPDLRERFHQEARVAAGLDHPNIVAVHEAGEVGPVCYLASTYCPGPTLASWLKRQAAPVPLPEAAQLMVTLAEAVQHAHSRGVLHRDLKPSNILLAGEPEQDVEQPLTAFVPRVTDFGLAKLTELAADACGPEVRTRSGAVLGTASYMAPEQARGSNRDVGPAVDVYALGAILYELLTGRPPFRGETDLETLLQVHSEEPLPPSRLRPRLPRDVETICLKCLQKEPHKRYSSARELAEDLQRFLAGDAIRARPTSAAERVVKWAKRRPAVAGLIAAVALITMLGLSGILWQWHRAEVGREEAEAAQGNAERALGAEEQARQREQVQRQEAERNLYFRLITLAHQAEQSHQVTEAERFLNECPPALRQWEWYYLKRQCRAEILLLDHRDGPVANVAFDAGSQRLWSLSRSSLKSWEGSNGKERGHWGFPFRPATPQHVAVSPDRQRFAVAWLVLPADPRAASTTTVYEAGTFKELYSLRGGAPVVFSPDGKRLATAGADITVKVWDGPTGRELQRWTGHTSTISCLAFSADGRLLASGSDRTVRVWDTVTARPLHHCGGHTGWARGLAFRPDGRQLASASDDKTVRLWDMTSGAALLTLCGHTQAVHSVQYNPTGQHLASAGADRTILFWDATTGQELRTCRGHTDGIQCLAFSPDGQRLASGGWDGTVRIWPVPPGVAARSLRSASVVFCPDGRCLAAIVKEDKRVEIEAVETGQLLHTIVGEPRGVMLSPTGNHVVLNRPAGAGRGPLAPLRYENVVWDTRGGRTIWALPPGTMRVTFSPDGQHLVTRGPVGERSVVMREVATGKELLTFRPHTSSAQLFTFSPDGRCLAVVGVEGDVKVWDTATGRELVTFRGHRGPIPIRSVAFSADGRRLATGGVDRTVHLWDTATGQLLHTFQGHTGPVQSVAFHPEGRLVSGDGKSIKVWDLDTLQEVLSLPWEFEPTQLVFSPDGGRLVAASSAGTVQLWNGTPRTED